MNRRLLFISVVLFLLTLAMSILSIGSVMAQRPNGAGGDQSVQHGPFTKPTLEPTGSGWLDVRPPMLASITSPPTIAPIDCGTMSQPIIGYEISRGQGPVEEVGFLNDLATQGYSLGTVDLSTNVIPPCI